MSGSLKPYLYFVLFAGITERITFSRVSNPSRRAIGNGEHICQNLALGAENEAIVLIFGNINTDTNHLKYLQTVYLMLGKTAEPLLL